MSPRKKQHRIIVYVSPAEEETLREAAGLATLSNWAKHMLLAKAEEKPRRRTDAVRGEPKL